MGTGRVSLFNGSMIVSIHQGGNNKLGGGVTWTACYVCAAGGKVHRLPDGTRVNGSRYTGR